MPGLRRLKRLIVLVVVMRLSRLLLRALAHWLEQRHHGATRASRTLVWVGDALPRSGHARARA